MCCSYTCSYKTRVKIRQFRQKWGDRTRGSAGQRQVAGDGPAGRRAGAGGVWGWGAGHGAVGDGARGSGGD